jgi:uncharacterized membrane protein YjjP (DUF1212 family)
LSGLAAIHAMLSCMSVDLPAPANPATRDSTAPYMARVDFLVELARRLHMYGTSAQRLEGAVSQVAQRLQVEAEVWSNPTGLILSFADPERGPGYPLTRVIRLEPGQENLGRLAAADGIAEDVLAGRRHIADGLVAMRALDGPDTRFRWAVTVLSFGLASASVTGLMRNPGWADLVTAATLGILIGVLTEASQSSPRWADAYEAVSAFLATLIATAVATFIAPLSLQNVIIAALIVLMPGLTLTTAVSELTSRQLVSGTARFAGALTVLLKLTFGAVAAAQVVNLFGWTPMPNAGEVLPPWMPWLTLLAGSFAFAVLFKAARRDVLLVMASVWLGFAVTRLAQLLPGAAENTLPGGVFFAGMVVTAASNWYGLHFNRPGALVRVPGIILLVPGSLGFRSFNFVFERDVMLGLDTAFAVVTALIALVAGILFGNLLLPPRRNL